MNLFKFISGSNAQKNRLAPPSGTTPNLLARALEPRILFDGAAMTTGAEALAEPVENMEIDSPPADDDASLVEALSQIAAASTDEARTEVLFVDAGVQDYQDLLSGLDSNIEIHILAAGEDSLSAMAQTLEGRRDIDAIHVISYQRVEKVPDVVKSSHLN